MWKQQGIDAGEFSRSLMRYAKQAIKDGETNPVKGALRLAIQNCGESTKISGKDCRCRRNGSAVCKRIGVHLKAV